LLVHALATERFGQIGLGVKTLVDAHLFLGSLTVQNFGTEEQKSRHLPETSIGQSFFAYAGLRFSVVRARNRYLRSSKT
jgi:alkylation response protein AidB-like acyl-CoA dehydrogenase